MNFFEHQERARRHTVLLVAYFLLAVLLTATAVNLVLWLGVPLFTGRYIPLDQWLFSEANLWATGITLAIILGGTFHRLWQLRDGGEALAHLVGAREVVPETAASDELRLLNIVEEMSIASGVPVPRLFVMPRDQTINAFVAGFRPTETVLVVTQGALDQLERDELQGVIGHEYSHIFNGDMRLNLRLMAILAGLVTVGRTGRALFFGNTGAGWGRSRASREDAVVHFAPAIVGYLLMIVGAIGVFFGRLIKAAISRQRELLADASSVQFTRNPAGLAGALMKIGEFGSELQTAHAEDMSHMCLGQTLRFRSLGGLMATHPPIMKRLEALGPEWAARARVRARRQAREAGEDAAPQARVSTAVAAASTATGSGAAAFAGTPAPTGGGRRAGRRKPATTTSTATGASAQVGRVQPQHMGYARSIHELIPDELHHKSRHPGAACWVVYALVISVSREEADTHLEVLEAGEVQGREIHALVEEINRLGSRVRLPLLDLCIPALKHLEAEDRRVLLETLLQLVRADQRMTLFEFVLVHILRDHLSPGSQRNRHVRVHRYRAVYDEIQLLLSAMIHAGGHRGMEAEELFTRVRGTLLPANRGLLPPRQCRLDLLERALRRLQGLPPMLKAPLVDACAYSVLSDQRVQVAEAELLRGICTLLDCPMPPLFPQEQAAVA